MSDDARKRILARRARFVAAAIAAALPGTVACAKVDDDPQPTKDAGSDVATDASDTGPEPCLDPIVDSGPEPCLGATPDDTGTTDSGPEPCLDFDPDASSDTGPAPCLKMPYDGG